MFLASRPSLLALVGLAFSFADGAAYAADPLTVQRPVDGETYESGFLCASSGHVDPSRQVTSTLYRKYGEQDYQSGGWATANGRLFADPCDPDYFKLEVTDGVETITIHFSVQYSDPDE
jgi:hypothetical protein